MSSDRPLLTHDLPPAAREDVVARAARAIAVVDGVRLAWVFGSFLRGEPFRDLDIAVVLDDRLAWRVPGRVADTVWTAVGQPTWAVDVVVLNDAAFAFRAQVVRTGRLLYERTPGDADAFAVRAWSEATDYLEWRRVRDLDGAPGRP